MGCFFYYKKKHPHAYMLFYERVINLDEDDM